MKKCPHRAKWLGLVVGIHVAPWLGGCHEKKDERLIEEPVTQPARAASGSGEPEPPTPNLPPDVDLSGRPSQLAVTNVSAGPRIYSRHLRLWVHEEPSRASNRLGYLRAGGSSPTSPEPVGSQDCRGGWFPVEPEGFVCLDRRATLEPNDQVVRLFSAHPPRSNQRLPYRYGTVRKPGPMFGRVPSLSDLKDVEPGFRERFPKWLSIGGEIGAGFRQEVWDWDQEPPNPSEAWHKKLSKGIPQGLKSDDQLASPTLTPRPKSLVIDRMESRVGHAFLETFFSEGRRYGLTTHLEVVPTDRYRPIVGSSFHGVEIGKDVDFPFAFVRRIDAKYSDGEKAEYRDVLPLTGKKKFINERLHYETESGKYISDRFASELTLAKKMPGWAKKGEKWMSVSINKQTLVLYEGEAPVYATLVSTGEAGLDDAESSTATKRGIFRVHTKHITATMASDDVGEEFELRDVPYVQYFAKGGYALHGAYWHDRFGMPKSHGCINLSPEDARRIFHWTEPRVPPGWHGALLPLTGTVVFVHP